MIYEFKCPKGHITEIMTNETEIKKTPCEICGRQANRIISSFGFNATFLKNVREAGGYVTRKPKEI